MLKPKFFLILFATVIFSSCNSDTSQESTPVTTEQEVNDYTKIKSLETNMLHGDGKTNMNVSVELLRRTKSFLKNHPKSANIEEVLHIGSNAARGLGLTDEAVSLLTFLADSLVTNEDSHITYLYTKAFVLDEAGKKEEAKTVYKIVAEKYPDHEFGRDSQARLETIDLTDEQLIQWLNQKSGANQGSAN